MATDSSDHEKQKHLMFLSHVISHFYFMYCKENSSLNLENSLMMDLHSDNHCCISVTESGTRSALRLTREEAYVILTFG